MSLVMIFFDCDEKRVVFDSVEISELCFVYGTGFRFKYNMD